MRVHVRPMRRQGRNLPQKEVLAQPPVTGIFSVSEERDHELGRCTIRARVFDEKNGTDVLPELQSAILVWADKNRMRFVGTERIEKADFAQAWSVEVL